MSAVDVSDPTNEKPAEGASAPAADDDDAEGFGMSDVLLDSVTKDEWKSIEAALSHHKKTVAEMLKRSCAQVRTKGELVLDESNGKFLGDMLPEMENFATWCYKEHVRPKIVALLPVDLESPDVEEAGDKKKKGGGGGGKKGGGGGKTPRGGGGGGEKIPAKTQIKSDNVMRIMNGQSAKDKGKKVSATAFSQPRTRRPFAAACGDSCPCLFSHCSVAARTHSLTLSLPSPISLRAVWDWRAGDRMARGDRAGQEPRRRRAVGAPGRQRDGYGRGFTR
jgi:hypothetical protein